MSDRRLETSEKPEVVVLAHGRLYVRGWEKPVVELDCADNNCTLTMNGGIVRADGRSRMELRVPQLASLKVTGFGEVTIRDVLGVVEVEQSGGSLNLRNVGRVSVQSSSNDLTARSIAGDLVIHQVGRFLNARDIAGNLTAEFINGHANVKEVRGDVKFETGGNANVVLDVSTPKTVELKSAGVITCRVRPGLNANVTISSYSPISVNVGDTQIALTEGDYSGVFGAGEGEFKLIAEGPVSLFETRVDPASREFHFDLNLGEDLAGLGGTIGEQISGQLEMISEELDARMSGLSDLVGMADIPAEKAEDIQRQTEEKIARAQEKIRRAQDRAARKIAEAQRRAEARAQRETRKDSKSYSRSFKINLSDLKKSARTKSDPVSDEERLMILNMVAENKITLEEAEALLSALEGN